MSIFGKPFLTGVGKGSASGAVANFTDGAKGLPLKSLLVNIDLVQDLDGYDNPWPAGGGKNKLPNGEQSATNNDIIFTKNADGSISVSGTASGNAFYVLCNGDVTLPAGNYALSGGKSSDVLVAVRYGSTTGSNIEQSTDSGEKSFDLSEDTVIGAVIRVASGTTINTTIYPMVRLRADGDATFAPYSNICPISGWSAVNVWRTGKNLLPISDRSSTTGFVNNHDGSWDVDVENPAANTYPSGILAFASLGVLPAGTYTASAFSSDKTSFSTLNVRIGKGPAYTFVRSDRGYATFQADGLSEYWYTFSVPAGTTVRDTVWLQVNYGTPASEYAPYSGNQYTIQLGQTVYGGTRDVTNGVLKIALKGFSYSSVDYYGIYEGHPLYMMSIPDYSTEKIKKMVTQFQPGVLISNILKKTTGTLASALGDCEIRTNDDTSISRFYFRADSFTDLTALNTYLSTNPLQVVAELETPITIPLSPQEISTLQGQNNVWADSGDVNVEYLKKSLMQIGSSVLI